MPFPQLAIARRLGGAVMAERLLCVSIALAGFCALNSVLLLIGLERFPSAAIGLYSLMDGKA